MTLAHGAKTLTARVSPHSGQLNSWNSSNSSSLQRGQNRGAERGEGCFLPNIKLRSRVDE